MNLFIYYERIQPIELDVNKLLAMITYKNIFPKDFSDLQLGQGFVHTLFKNKDNFANEEINKIEQKIHALEEEIKLIKEEHLNNMDELDAVFLKIDNLGITVNGKSISHFDTHVQFVKALKKNPSEIKCSRYTGVSFNVHEKLNQLLENPKYAKRKENIEKKTNNKIEDLEFKRQKMKKQKYVIKNGSFKDLITRENIDDIFSVSFKNELGDENKFEEIKASPYFPLIKYLIRHGFINETYADYMTYFYGNSLTRVDKIFLRSVSDKIAKEYSYSLDDPKMVLSRLHVADFDNEETLNFGLLEYLLKQRIIT